MVEAQVHMRWTIRRDMPEVMRIERECFEFQWTEEDWHKCLSQRNCIGMVAEVAECVVGAMVYELLPNRLHVLNFAVRPERRGIGTVMVNKLKSKLSYERRKRIVLDVRESNLAAQKFFSSQGFRAIGVQRGFYQQHTTEDAYLFQYRLPVCEGK